MYISSLKNLWWGTRFISRKAWRDPLDWWKLLTEVNSLEDVAHLWPCLHHEGCGRCVASSYAEWLIVRLGGWESCKSCCKKFILLWSEYGSMVWTWFECVLTLSHDVVRSGWLWKGTSLPGSCQWTGRHCGTGNEPDLLSGDRMALHHPAPPTSYFRCLQWSDAAKRGSCQNLSHVVWTFTIQTES